jgi:hypothetical protein
VLGSTARPFEDTEVELAKVTLRRYTNLASAIHMLDRKVITLLSPALWDDRNDAYFLNLYKERKAAKSVLALCFAETFETYHHWRVFASGLDGVCIEFDRDKLLSSFKRDDRISSRSVEYRQIPEIRRNPPLDDELPFLKRFPYQDEMEFRIIYSDTSEAMEAKSYPIKLRCIARITLSPWMPAPLVDSVKRALHIIDGCSRLKVYRSTLIENEKWKKAANPGLKLAAGA